MMVETDCIKLVFLHVKLKSFKSLNIPSSKNFECALKTQKNRKRKSLTIVRRKTQSREEQETKSAEEERNGSKSRIKKSFVIMLLHQEPLVGIVPKPFVFFILEIFFFNTLDNFPLS
jgi:hypothetical protein